MKPEPKINWTTSYDATAAGRAALEILCRLVSENRHPFNGETSEAGRPSDGICTRVCMPYKDIVAARQLALQLPFIRDMEQESAFAANTPTS